MSDDAPQQATAAEKPPVASEPSSREDLETKVVDVLKTVYDPEIPVDIYELGLVYGVEVRDDRSVSIRLTLTSPMCPVAGSLPPEVEAKVAQIPGVTSSTVEVVWDPPWNPSMMSEAAKLELGWD
jgi:FeS assembly SUF system protein